MKDTQILTRLGLWLVLWWIELNKPLLCRIFFSSLSFCLTSRLIDWINLEADSKKSYSKCLDLGHLPPLFAKCPNTRSPPPPIFEKFPNLSRKNGSKQKLTLAHVAIIQFWLYLRNLWHLFNQELVHSGCYYNWRFLWVFFCVNDFCLRLGPFLEEKICFG